MSFTDSSMDPSHFEPNGTMGEYRAERRRAEDRGVAENVTHVVSQVDGVIAWVKRWRAFLALGGVALAALVPFLSWAGATQSSPGQRLDAQKVRIDSVIIAVSKLENIVLQLKTVQDSVVRASDKRVGLLLRITCRGMAAEYRDLLDDCREVGANR